MAKKDLTVLIVDDEPAHLEILRRSLQAAGRTLVVRTAGTLSEYRQSVAACAPDIAILDLNLPDGRAVDELGGNAPRRPFPVLVMTAHGNETAAVAAMKAGALDYFVKSAGTFAEMPRIIERALREWSLSEAQRQATEALRESEARYRRIIETTHEGFCEVDSAGRAVAVNPKMEQMFGYAPGELIGLNMADALYFPEDREVAQQRRERRRRGESESFEQRFRTKTGEAVWVHVSATPIIRGGVSCGSFAMLTDINERMRAEAELKRLRTAFEQTSETILITDDQGAILYVNPAFETATGYRREDALGKTARILKSGKHDAAFYRELWATISSGRTWRGRMVSRCKDGALRTEDCTISPVRHSDGRIVNYVAIKRDVTEHVRLEEEHRQSQKMESVGRLAGGVAHDFNNLLTAINGYARFVMDALPEDDAKRDDLKEILSAGERAAALTRQLLAFSRRQILNPQVLDINAVIGGLSRMLARLLGENITLVTRLAGQPCLVKVDTGQIEQVLLNLALNARDAMPRGGTLTFASELVPADLARRPLVCLNVTDTGCGMTDEVKSHLFEPFFTTKEKGKGTGLGLSMVFGIVKQSGGEVEVESAPGRGATFRIMLPLVDPSPQGEAAGPAESAAAHGSAVRGHETVLLVEDEAIVRRLGERALAGYGYTVLTAADGVEALKVLERHGRAVDLLITDVVMPGMSGRELAREVAVKELARRTLFVSGYSDDAIVDHGVLEPGLAFLPKPFSPDSLLRKAREVLDGPADQARG